MFAISTILHQFYDRRGSGVNQYIVENFFSVLNVDTRMNREHALNVMNFIGTAD